LPIGATVTVGVTEIVLGTTILRGAVVSGVSGG